MPLNPLDDAMEQLPSTDDANPYEGIVQQMVGESDVRLRSTVRQGSSEQPDRAAESIKLGARYGMPPAVILRNLDQFKERARLDDASQFKRIAPTAAKWMESSPVNAAIGSDDMPQLSALERLGGIAQHLVGAASAGVMDFSQGIYGALQAGAELTGADRVAEFAKGSAAVAGSLASQMRPDLSDAGFVERNVYGGIEGAGEMIPALVAGALVGPAGVAGAFGLSAGGSSYARARAEGASVGRSSAYAGVESAIAVGTTFVPAHLLLGDLAANARFVTTLVHQVATGVPLQVLQNTLDDLSGWALLPENQDKPFSAYLNERPSAIAGATVAALAAIGAQTTIAHGTVRMLDRLGAVAQESKTVKRAPEAVQQIIDTATDHTPVYLPVDPFVEYFQSKNLDPSEMAAKVTGDPDALAKARESGEDLAVPLGRYTTEIAATEHHGFFANEVRLQPDAMNAREQQAFVDEQQQQAAQQQADAEAAKRAESAAKVREQMRAQFEAAGVEPSTADSYSQLYEHAFQTLGERAGIDPLELFNRYGLTVNRPDLAALAPGDTALDQAPRPEFVPVGGEADENADRAGAQTAQQQHVDQVAQAGEADKQQATLRELRKDQAIKIGGSEPLSTDAEPTVLEQRPPNADEPRGRIVFGKDRQFRIDLLQHADLSTVLHESGHLFLELMHDIAAERPESSVAEDLAALKKHYGTDAIGTEHHERFAREFEAYLMEGKAPSAELRGVFAKFRAWLVGVYRSLSGLNVRLNDHVRGVFDRLLASDEAIRGAEAESSIAPLFTTPESAGMTEKQFAAYRETVTEASLKARDELQRKVLGDLQRERESWWKTERASLREKVATEIQQEPIYQALAAMQKGTRPDGSPLVDGQPAEPIKLDRQALVDAYGKDILKQLPRPFVYTTEGGVHPDVAAQLFGFSSGDELVRALVEAPAAKQLIDTVTDQRMRARHGDLLLDGSLHDQARAAVETAGRAQVLEAEQRALAKKAREVAPFVQAERNANAAERRATVASVKSDRPTDVEAARLKVPPTSLLKDIATKRIAETTIGALRPSMFWAAAQRAGQAALDAVAHDDVDAALVAKQQQRLNVELYRAALAAREDVDTRVAQLRTFAKGPARERLGKAGEAYLDQVDGILDRYEFARVPQQTLARRASIVKFVEGLEAQGLPVDLPDEVLNDARRINYRQISYAELQGISDGVQEIAHLARLKNRLLKAQADRELSATADTLKSSIEARATRTAATGIEPRLPGSGAKRNIDQFFASHRKLSSLVRQFDGFQDGGPMWEHILRPLNEAADAEAVRNEQATIALHDIFQTAYKGEETSLFRKTFVPAINTSLTKMARLMVALNAGNEGNLDRLRSGGIGGVGPLADAQVRAVLDTLDARDAHFVQAVWDHLDSYWPDIAAKQKRVFGVAPQKVDPTPVVIGGEPLRGGYFPIKYENQLSARAASTLEGGFAEGVKQAAYVQATTQRGHTKERASRVREPLRADFGVITEHVQQVIHDLTHHETLLDVGRLLAQRGVQDAIYQKYGDITYDQIKGAVRDVAFGNQPAPGWYRTLNAIRANTVTATLGWNVVTSLMHTLQITRGMVRVGPSWVMKGLVRWASSAKNAENSVGWIEAQSDMMRLRWKTQLRDLNEVRNTVGLDRGKLSAQFHDALSKVGADPGAMPAIADSYFYAIRRIVQFAEIPTWIGAYEKAMADASNDHDRAVKLADQAVIDSMGSGHVKDLAAVQRAPMAKLLTTFYDYHNSVYNQAHELVKNSENPGRKIVDASLLLFVPVALGAALHHVAASRKDQKREVKAGVARTLTGEGVDYALGMFVGLRELSGAFTGRDYAGPAGLKMIPTARTFLARVGQEVGGKGKATALARATNELGGELFGYPAHQIDRTARGIQALWDGTAKTPSVLLFGPQQEH